MLDLLVKGGLIVDGSGNPGFYGAVGILEGRAHVFRGDLVGLEASRTIDATGKVVCPSFIDMHAHSGLVLLAEPRHEPKVFQGVTTEVIGVDGNSYAPFTSPEDFRLFYELNSGLDGAPDLPMTWSSVAEYLSLFDGRAAVNVACLIGNSPLRISAMGWDNRPTTDREMDTMTGLLRQGMEEGAFGLSTGLDYPPGSYADTDELVALTKEVGKLGAFTIPTSVTPWETGSWTPSERQWRSGDAAERHAT